MCRKIYLDKDTLFDLYINKQDILKDIALKLSCSVDTITKYLKEFKIPKRPYCSKLTKRIINLSDEMQDILDGSLLGDGHITKHGKNKINSQFVYSSSKKDHVEYIAKYFNEYLTNETKNIKKKEVFDKRTNKTYISYRIRTINNSVFTIIRNKWYPNGIKIIPKDIVLNNIILLIWYIGDGGIIYTKIKNKIVSFELKLSTHCFNVEDINRILIPQLKKYRAYTRKFKNNQHVIIIPRAYVYSFLNDIGDCPIESMRYKWEVPQYRRKIFLKRNKYGQYKTKFIELYKNGLTYYRIAKNFNVEPALVRHYLIQEGIYERRIGR